MLPQLVVNISKAGKKGARWSKHKYILRYVKPDGSYGYVRPTKDDGHFLDNGQFQLNPGVSLASIINRKLFGGPTGRVDKKTGEPEVRNGDWRTYVAVSLPQLNKERDEAKRFGREPPYQGAVGYQTMSKVQIGVDNDGKTPIYAGWRVYEFSTVPVVGHDADGKPIYGGFVKNSIEVHPSVSAKYGYTLPAKILQHEIQEARHLAVAQGVGLGATVPEGEVGWHAMDPAPTSMGVTPQPGDRTLRNPPPVRHTEQEIAQLSAVHTDDSVDPIAMAKELRDRIHAGSKAGRYRDRMARIEGFPAWAIDKFEDEQALLDKLQKQPVTTMLTLGKFRPSKWTTKLNEHLSKEWDHILLGLARDDFDGYKYTAKYEQYTKRDERDGIDPNSDHSRVRKYRKTVVDEHFQEARLSLMELAHKYRASEKKNDRFDKLAYATIRNQLKRRTRNDAIKDRTHVPIVREGDVEEAARKQGGKEPLSPREVTELKESTPLAKMAIHRILQTMPEAYGRILSARLWLDKPADELKQLDAKGAALEAKIMEAEEAGTTITRVRRAPGTWMRNLTGKDSVVEQYPTWTDPHSGEVVDLAAMTKTSQFRQLDRWWNEARAHLLRNLSVPVKRHEPTDSPAHIPDSEWKDGGYHVEVPVDQKDMTNEELLTHLAMGAPLTQTRVLSSEGKAVRRYLELETKLARENRRRWHSDEPAVNYTAKPVHEVSYNIGGKKVQLLNPPSITHTSRTAVVPHRPIIGPRAMTLPKKDQPKAHSAIDFFTSSQNQQLARRLGLRLDRMEVSARGQKLDAGGGVFVQPNISMGSVAQRELSNAEKHYDRLLAVQQLRSKPLHKEHVSAYTRLSVLQDLGQWSKKGSTTYWDHGKEGITALHEAAVAYHQARNLLQEKQARRSQARQSLAETEHTEAEIRHKLKPLQVSKKERAAHEHAKEKYLRIAKKIGELVPSIVAPYEEAYRRGESPADHHLSGARSMLMQAQNQARHETEILWFEKERRTALKKVKKGDVWIEDLRTAFDAYDWELGRLFAEMA